MLNPLVSVIIPVYNVEEFLSDCIESVVKQTYKNIEIIAINDGSTDKSLDILKNYANESSNLKIISQKNSGLSNTRNKGISVSKGKYIYFLDSDDFILPETVEVLVELMEKNSLDIIRFGAEPFVDGTDYKLKENPYDFRNNFIKDKVYSKYEFLNVNLNAFASQPCLYLIKKDLLLKNHLQFKPFILHEDELFTLELFLNSNAAMYCPSLFYKRRYRENSIMTSKEISKIKKSFDSYCILIKEMNDLFNKYKEPIEIKLIRKRIKTLYIVVLFNKELEKDYKREKLSNIVEISKFKKVFYTLRYKYGMRSFAKTFFKIS